MKRNLSLLLASVLVAAVAFAPVALAGPVGTLELNAGYNKNSDEVTPSGDAMGGGIGFGAAYWRGTSPSISWGGEVSFDNLGSAEYTDPFSSSTTKVSGSVFRINPAVRYTFGPGVGTSFYAQGGAGLYNVSAKVEDSVLGSADDSQSKIGFNFGAGVNFPVAPTTKMNVGLQYHTISTEGQSTNYLNFRAGVGFNL
ncbi:MAG TPA: outer membrane beta-barrel protein [Candidatus Eisenbacteria bacterium]|nr:outer membrane beta-barrel protein [Candidatus Eisenbacteria bacterium]